MASQVMLSTRLVISSTAQPFSAKAPVGQTCTHLPQFVQLRAWPQGRFRSHEILERMPREARSEEHTSELQSPCNLACLLLLEKKQVAAPEHIHNGGRDAGAVFDSVAYLAQQICVETSIVAASVRLLAK